MRNKKNIIMLVLLILVALMTGAYAAYTTNLNIGATTSQSGTYGVVLTGCTTEVVKIGTAGAQAPTATCSPTSTNTGEEAICTASFKQPGDSVRCKFNVKNTGNLKIAPNGAMSCDTDYGIRLYFPAGGFVSGLDDAYSTQWHGDYWVDPNKSNTPGRGSSSGGNITTNLPGSSSGSSGNSPSGNRVDSPPIGNAISGGGWWHDISGFGFSFVWNRNRLAPNATLTNEFSITLTAESDYFANQSGWNPEVHSNLDIVCDLPYGQDI